MELTFLTRESDPHVRAAAAAIAGVAASVVLALATLRAAGTEAILSAFCHKFKTLSTFASCVYKPVLQHPQCVNLLQSKTAKVK